LSAAIMLFTSETKVISVLIFDLNESGDLGAIAVLGIIMLVVTFAVVAAINRIPGFALRQHYFLPGFPVMAWPMLESVLDSEYGAHFNAVPIAERACLVFDTPESAVAPLMEAVEARFPRVKSFSLPSIGDGRDGKPARRHIELGVKGDPDQVDAAFDSLRGAVVALGAEVELLARVARE